MSSEQAWTALHLLAEPTRRRVYDAVRAAEVPVTREDVASATGIARRLAAFHLDLLTQAGLLLADYARPPGRTGPGAGRPAKRYRPVAVDLELQVPARRYDLAARILARAVDDAGGSAGIKDARERAMQVARAEGEQIGRLRRSGGRLSADETLVAAREVLDDLGYEPTAPAGGCVRLRNCRFPSGVDVAPQLACGVNDELVSRRPPGLGWQRSGAAPRRGLQPSSGGTGEARST